MHGLMEEYTDISMEGWYNKDRWMDGEIAGWVDISRSKRIAGQMDGSKGRPLDGSMEAMLNMYMDGSVEE